MNILLTPFVYLAGLGLGLSFIVHVSSLTGVPLPLPFGVDLRLLNKVMFVVFTVTIIASNSITRGFKLNEFSKAALRACPKWMKYLPVFLLGYALFIAALAQILMSYYSAGGGNTTEITFKKQEGSAFSLALYSISMAMLYAARAAALVACHREIESSSLGLAALGWAFTRSIAMAIGLAPVRHQSPPSLRDPSSASSVTGH